jgi:hypothetical protein
MRVRLFLLGFAVFSISLLVTGPAAQAKVRSRHSTREAKPLIMHRDPTVKQGSARHVNRRMVSKMLRHVRSKASICSVQDGGTAGATFGDCLRSWGINSTTIAGCVGICVAAGTGNPVAIGFCAACLGTGEWIVAYCAAKGLLGGVIAPVEGPVASKRPRLRQVRATL